MILNLFLALKKIDQLIFKIIQDKFMFEYMKKIIMNGKLKRNGISIANEVKTNEENNLNFKENPKSKKEGKPKKKLNWFEKLTNKKSSSKNSYYTENIDNIDNFDNINDMNNKMPSNKSPINNNEDKNNKEEHPKHLRHFFENNPKNNDAIGQKKFTNYFYNFHDNENPVQDKNFKNYFKNNIQVINNYNIYNLSEKKRNLLENDNNKENNVNNENSNDFLNINKRKKSSNKYKKHINNTSLINGKSNCSNPPIKKKANNLDENEYSHNIENFKKRSRKHKAQSFRIKRKAHTKIVSRCILNETPASLISNQSIINSKKEEEGAPKEAIFSKKNYRVSKDVINIYKSMGINKKKENSKRKNQNQNNNNIKYIDEELNRMEYEDAIINDKRNYLRYYYSLLEKKQLIILTFIANNDYNVFLLKFSLFIISFMIYFSINTLFFRDSTMRRIFIDQGKFKLIYQIPQILYSTLISIIITFILKRLSLSQNELIKIRKEKDKKKANKISETAKKNLKIKLYLFFIIGMLLILFCWYYIAAFGAVYPNTQMYLIKDTLISFAISMSYPFGYNLIPGLFRFPALKAKKKDKKSLYDFSKILSKL